MAAIRVRASTRLKNELEQHDHDDQPDEKDDADSAAEKLEHGTLRKI
jgi:hypothetical protein